MTGTVAPLRQVRALHDARTIRVYQAFSAEIADGALRAQRFVPPFSRSRMTWVKPSFTWMMYRSSWGTAPGQERVLAIDVAREGFEWALGHACLSHFDAATHPSREDWEATLAASPVRVQWDPERTPALAALPWRTIQVGLGGEAVARYVDAWTVGIEDVTPLAREIEALVREGDLEAATRRLPPERPVPLPAGIARRIGADAH